MPEWSDVKHPVFPGNGNRVEYGPAMVRKYTGKNIIRINEIKNGSDRLAAAHKTKGGVRGYEKHPDPLCD